MIIGNGFGGVIFHEACGHLLETTSVAKKASVFHDQMGEMIASPIVNAVDDGLQLFHNAEYANDNIPNARLVRFEKGGHFVIGIEQSIISATVADHILEHPSVTPPSRLP